MSDPATLAFYQREAPVYTASGSRSQSRHLGAFLDSLAPEARILELGCGGGRDTEYMAARGFDVDATDGSSEMVAQAKERTGLPVRAMLFEELDRVDEYDAVWAHACLLHVPRSRLSDILTRIEHALKPGGWFFANFKSGNREGRDDLGRYYNFPDRDWLERQYREAVNWAEIIIELGKGSGYDGVEREWIAITAKKA